MLKRGWLQALCAAVCVLALTGCGDECVDSYDCRNNKGSPPEGQSYQCIEGTCELKNIPEPQPSCSPECATGEFCDTSSGQGVCLTCSATQGCSAPLFCDVSANGGKGLCRACSDTTPTGTDQGCSATAPVCDAAGGNGAGVCKACMDSAATGTDVGCSANTPVCDSAGGNGAGVCKACTDSAQGTSTDLGCTDTAPICNTASSNGAGQCKSCVDSAQGAETDLGCVATTPICATAANSGRGVCRACVDSAAGTAMDQGCSATTPICDAAAGNGAGICRPCLDSAAGSATDLGCAAVTPLCDPTAANGVGACQTCLDSAQGATTDQGCADTAPLCDRTGGNGTGACRICMNSATGSSTDVGCSATEPLCDSAAASGAGTCRVCMDTAAPEDGTADDGCSSPTSICDAAASNGAGICKVCLTSNEGCPGSQTCNTEGTACEGCADNSSCTTPGTPVCKPPPPVSVCVECTDNTHCSTLRPVCETATNFCGCTSDAECAATNSDTDFCDTTASNGRGLCKVCITDANCLSADSTKPYCDNQTACIQCRTNADCSLSQVCNASKACEAVPGADPGTTSGQIGSINTGTVGAQTPPITIENAFVTYIKPAVGSDVAGFFLQAQADGPAAFVNSDPSTLQIGDRVTLTVNEIVELSGKIKAATNITGLTIVSRGHPVQNLASAAQPGLAVDRTSATDLATAVDTYFGEIIRLTGTITASANPGSGGLGHTNLPINTTGVSGNVLRLRLADPLVSQYEIGANCTFTLDVGPMWKFTNSATPPVTTAQPSAYTFDDFSALSCPAPKVVSVLAPTNTTVKVVFDRSIDPASITDAATQFSFTDGLMATGATVSGKEVTLTTTAQSGGATYTLSVAGSVKDTLGTSVATPNSAKFTTFLAVRGAQLVIGGTGFTGATEVTIGGQTQPFTVNSDTQVTITGVTDATPLGSQPVVVTTPGGAVPVGNTLVINLVINEYDSDTPLTDMAEFVEVSTGAPNLTLSGFVLVFYNGSNDQSYLALDLYATTDANGLILAGNPGITNRVLTFADNTLQNGQDAIAIYQGSSAAFPNGTPVTASGLIDAAVYDTADADDPVLLDILLGPVGDPRRVQVDEAAGAPSDSQSIQRCGGTARRDGRVFSKVGAPSPGTLNTCP